MLRTCTGVTSQMQTGLEIGFGSHEGHERNEDQRANGIQEVGHEDASTNERWEGQGWGARWAPIFANWVWQGGFLGCGQWYAEGICRAWRDEMALHRS